MSNLYKTSLFLSLMVGTLLQSCIEPQKTFSKIPEGTWRGVLYLQESPVAVSDKNEITYGEDRTGQLPFNFDVIYDNDSSFHIEIRNAEEVIRVDDITFGRTKELAKDTVGIHFKVYDTYISALYEEDLLEGYWHVNYRENYKVKFRAVHGDNRRFILPVDNTSPANFSGRWDLIFGVGTDSAYPGIGDFQQEGNKITGTVETETGDFRFLEGSVSGNKSFLSCFDGAHAYLIESKILEDGTYSGLYYSGNAYIESLTGSKNPDAKLKDGFNISKSVSSAPVAFSATDTEGHVFSLTDQATNDHIKVLMLMGTWCPNCKDATAFLKEFLKSEAGAGVSVASVAFERYRDTTKIFDQLRVYKEKSEIPWPVVLGGYYNKKEASISFKLLDTIKAYPTLVMIDQNNQIRDVFTGFYGPATSKYIPFKEEFYSKIESLKNE